MHHEGGLEPIEALIDAKYIMLGANTKVVVENNEFTLPVLVNIFPWHTLPISLVFELFFQHRSCLLVEALSQHQ